ncbi:MAG: lipid-A-disaccharide synthase [Bdellovibrionaceae bacterium]|nr:lipid-A-disaccharide synthase [Pseudobdellovibrionaceae bacterium]
MSSVMIVAAEASSALFAQRLLEHWKTTRPELKAFGVGTHEMEALGFERLGKAEDMAVVGAFEIIQHYPLLRSVFDKLVEEASKRRPKVVIVLDYPEFNLMLSKKLKQLGLKVVYYVSPQVWAWRQGRVKTIKKYCEKVFLLFPFEVPFYARHQVPYEFVGHPILDELDERLLDPESIHQRRRRCGIADDEIVLGLMPGSRRGEIRNHFSIQLEVARRLAQKHPKLKIIVLVAPTREKEELLPYLESFPYPYILMKDEPFRMISLTDFVLAASGTATLMVGLLEKPMVIMYRMSFLTSLFARLVVRGHFGLVNLIAGREIVPERFQERANPDHLFELMDRYITHPEYAAQVKEELKVLKTKLGDKGATLRVARSLEEYFR